MQIITITDYICKPLPQLFFYRHCDATSRFLKTEFMQVNLFNAEFKYRGNTKLNNV